MADAHLIINLAGDFYVPNIEGWSLGPLLSALLQKGDVNVINFEAPVRTEGTFPIKKSGPSLYQDQRAPQWLIKQGFNLFDCANNHICDFGSEALQHTIASIPFPAQAIGAGSFYEAYSIKNFEVKGKKIGFLALTQFEFGIHDEELTTKDKMAAAWMCHPIVSEIISKAHQQYDILIVLSHAGLEHFHLPLPELRTLYRHFVSMGADAVVASHPHVPQPWEVFQGKPIFYSLGNFCFDMTVQNRQQWCNSLLAQLQIGAGNKIELRAIPIQFSTSERTVEICSDDAFIKYMNKLNKELMDERLYLEKVNNHCLSLYPLYQTIMEMGGYHRVSSIKEVICLMKKQITAILKGNKALPNDAHFINTMRCETHRWIMSRIYELQNRQ